MADPAANFVFTPRSQLALFLPNDKAVEDYENNTTSSQANADQLTEAAQNAEDALTASSANATLLNGQQFLLLGPVPASGMSQSRRLRVSSDLTLTDSGPTGNATVGLNQQTLLLPATVADNTGLFTAVPAFNPALAANSTYLIEAALTFQSAALTTGIGLAWLLPAGASISGGYTHPGATAAAVQSAYNQGNATVSANTSAVPVINANLPIVGRWIVKITTAGSILLDFRSGTAAVNVSLIQDLSAISFRKIA